jgi:hypothetical protein
MPPPLTPQVSDSFPFKWINKKWKEGFYVTSMATSHTRWAVVMSRNAGFVDQVRLLGVLGVDCSCWGMMCGAACLSSASCNHHLTVFCNHLNQPPPTAVCGARLPVPL